MFDVEWDGVLGCYCLHFAGEIICLGSQTLAEAREEANLIVEAWV